MKPPMIIERQFVAGVDVEPTVEHLGMLYDLVRAKLHGGTAKCQFRARGLVDPAEIEPKRRRRRRRARRG